MDKIIELSVEDFKAVKKADISLNGITVVSGINGCGKSSLSQLLYYSFYYANQYDEIVETALNHELSKYSEVLKQIEREIKNDASTDSVVMHNVTVHDKGRYLNYVGQLFTRFIYYRDFVVHNKGSKDTLNSFNRIVRIIGDTLDNSLDTLDELLNLFYSNIERVFNDALKEQEVRDYFYLENFLEFDLKRILPRNWIIREYGVPFAGNGTKNVPLLHYIKRVAYIDTPMIVGNQLINGKSYWWNLAKLMNHESHVEKYIPLYNSFSQIMNGESIVKEDGVRSPQLAYKRNDGRIFDLSDCATGIKAFSILQLLLKNGFLQKDTLLIIDEPEAHLHPQWIVEYARMIVMLHKEIGVKFFIASHSTDMVSAIRYIAAKQEVQESLNFYLAEDSKESPYEYTYRDLGLDIDPIFKSFNKSFDKIDEYGVYD